MFGQQAHSRSMEGVLCTQEAAEEDRITGVLQQAFDAAYTNVLRRCGGRPDDATRLSDEDWLQVEPEYVEMILQSADLTDEQKQMAIKGQI